VFEYGYGKEMSRISYSQISMYNDCPLRWKLNYVDRVTISESSIHLIFGTAMHDVLQTYLNIMYMDSVKNADTLDLNKMLRDKLIEQFKQAEEPHA
jgi:UDP-N-acetylglucosamine 2-epimerase